MFVDVIQSDERLHLVHLYNEEFACSFGSFKEEDGVVSITITVAKDRDYLITVKDRDVLRKAITGDGSLRGLLAILRYMNGPFLDYCREYEFDTIMITPSDDRRYSAYRRLLRYGFKERLGSYYKFLNVSDEDLDFESLLSCIPY